MRDLFKLVNDIIEVTPDYETDMILELHNVKKSIPYTAPEIMIIRFQEVSRIVNDHIKDLNEPWKNHVVWIWTDGSHGTPINIDFKGD